MKRTLLLTACVAGLIGQALAADDLKTFLMKDMPKMEKAFLTGDVSYFDKASTADFTMTEMGRTMTKKESLQQMAEMNKMYKMTKVKVKILSAVTKGNKGTAKTTMHTEMVSLPAKKGDKTHVITTESYYTETYVRVGNSWKIQKIVPTKPGKMLMDGKPFDPPKMGG